MKRNNTDRLLAPGFLRMCMANTLLFMAVYMLMAQPMSEHHGAALPFLLGLFAAGPFHAYLGDAHKRKFVYMLGVLFMLPFPFLYETTPDIWLKAVCLFAYGACFAIAVTAGITITIDITPSPRRTRGNVVYALAGRIGMLLGLALSVCGFHTLQAEAMPWLLKTHAVMGIATLLLAANVRVPFRAPIGTSLCNVDRFFLPHGWLPFLNLCLLTMAVVPLFMSGWQFLVVAVLLLWGTLYFTKIFVNLSQHCQRGTANTTCHLAIDTGFIAGTSLWLHRTTGCEYAVSGLTLPLIALLASALLFFLITLPYYKRMRVR